LALEPGYSAVANEQLDGVLASGNNDLHDDLVETYEGILDDPGGARTRSSAVVTEDRGIVFCYAVPRRGPYKVFWSSDGPIIEAVFPYPA
jgi:hypothetical protein